MQNATAESLPSWSSYEGLGIGGIQLFGIEPMKINSWKKREKGR